MLCGDSAVILPSQKTPVTDFRLRITIGTYSGGTVRDSHPVILFSKGSRTKPLPRSSDSVVSDINLLREGLDLPEVSLVAILDADKEGFLRSETALVQTIGRAARNAEGKVILYADTITPSMQRAMDETARRREKQDAYNKANGIVPKTVIKSVRELLEISGVPEDSAQREGRGKAMNKQERAAEIARLEKAMKEAAKMLEFELAADLRDQIIRLRGEM